MKQDIYLPNGQLFATEYERVVYGGRGAYIEFTLEQILLPLVDKTFTYERDNVYYIWKRPICSLNTKVYYQLKTVSYADYKVGKYYVSPLEFKDFRFKKCLF